MLEFDPSPGATPLTADELAQLIPNHVATMAQLNEAEQVNIAQARLWALSRRRTDVLTTAFARQLHKRMFQDVWRWAGTFRTRPVNIGNVDAYAIGVRLHQLFDDGAHWIEARVFGADEIAARLHHGLTVIHPFPNGNGRHSRLLTDVLLRRLDVPLFTWGGGADLVHGGDTRKRYLEALRAADAHDMTPLIRFARS